MEWKEFKEKYSQYKDEFNGQEFNERCRVSNLMTWEAVRELIRSKKHLRLAIQRIDDRIKTLSKQLDEDLKTNPINQIK